MLVAAPQLARMAGVVSTISLLVLFCIQLTGQIRERECNDTPPDRANADQPADMATDEIRDPRVIAAMTRAWGQAASSWVKGVEAGFRIDAAVGGFTVVGGFTNESMTQKISINPGRTIAIYHVHPKYADAQPSRADIKLGDTWFVRVYVMHVTGLYVYDPALKQSRKLRSGVSWLKP